MSDEPVYRTEIFISNLLRFGVVASLLFVIVGTVLSFIHHPDYFTSSETFLSLTQPGAVFPHTVADVIQGVLQGNGQAIVTFGLLFLIATPILRVAVSIFVFIQQKDRLFSLITFIVLCILILSFVLGKTE